MPEQLAGVEIIATRVYDSRLGCPVRLEYPFKRTDAGKAYSHYPRQRNDCTVRALATACGLPYDDAHHILAAKAGRSTGKGCNFRAFMLAHWPSIPKQTYPATAGQRRMNPASFAAQHTTGTYIVSTARHVIAVIDGTFYDNEPPRPDRCIYVSWRIR